MVECALASHHGPTRRAPIHPYAPARNKNRPGIPPGLSHFMPKPAPSSAASQALHFFLHPQFLNLQPGQSRVVGARTMVLVENTHLQPSVTFLQALNSGLQAHGASMRRVTRLSAGCDVFTRHNGVPKNCNTPRCEIAMRIACEWGCATKSFRASRCRKPKSLISRICIAGVCPAFRSGPPRYPLLKNTRYLPSPAPC